MPSRGRSCRHEVALLQRVVDWVAGEGAAEGWKIAGRWDPKTHVGALSLITPNLEDLHPQTFADMLDTSFAIAVRPGLHCAPYIHRTLGTFPDGTLRLSPGPFTSGSDIDTFLSALTEISAGAM